MTKPNAIISFRIARRPGAHLSAPPMEILDLRHGRTSPAATPASPAVTGLALKPPLVDTIAASRL